jgi:2-dehydro-3-deoxyphosphogluconate aldolase / (4S)-4-hydroxy-2-oxoglutarate aldolase
MEMKRIETIQKIVECGVVAVIRAESKEEGIKIIEAVRKGGIKALEITMTWGNRYYKRDII